MCIVRIITKPSQCYLIVLFKNQDLLVISKPPDVRMDGNFSVTVATICEKLMPMHTDKFRWVHQLDYATSGVLAIALNHEAASKTCQMFQNRRTRKEYLAIVRGTIPFALTYEEANSALMKAQLVAAVEEEGSVVNNMMRYVTEAELKQFKDMMEVSKVDAIHLNNSSSRIASDGVYIPPKPRPAGTD